MYNSPLKLFTDEITRDIAKKQDTLVFNAVARLGVTVDRDELLRALRYDRGQYDKGYADGKADGRASAMAEIVRCKECIFRPTTKGDMYGTDVVFPYEDMCPLQCEDPYYNQMMDGDFFCANGERRDDDA